MNEYKVMKYRNKLAKLYGGYETRSMSYADQFVEKHFTPKDFAVGYKQFYLREQRGGAFATIDTIDNAAKQEMINAAKAGNGQKIKELVEKYGPRITRNLDGYTALGYIAGFAEDVESSGEAVTCLVNAVKSAGYEVEIDRAAETRKIYGDYDLDSPYTFEDDTGSTLQVAYYENNLNVMRALVKHGAIYDEHAEGAEEARNLPERPPEAVFLMNYEDAKEEMVDAAENGDVQKIRELVEKYGSSIATVDLDGDKYTALHIIAEDAPNKPASGEAITYLIKNVTGIQIDAKTWGGLGDFELTPLHLASMRGNTIQVKALLINGANRAAKSIYETTPADVICRDTEDKSNFEIIKTLLAKGGDGK